ncbi:restriction endonuclease subunit S [Streptococcus mitis]|jgi:sty sbli|uniref:Restriction endonuclease subunit S n=2 Tax=Streptococcus mitis TaxID=28037 RepID=A0A6L5H2R1_STRMT|nr:restriction endonuclease subunit S [Streptococcus mitis]MQP59240.1 restriction endonuclease subunit S [Streptococcus mitis]MQP68840.1 restriction endonuclease subunit S [Streptococcus mitis]MQP70716.1 restriction endonuclease subunit S [Streptococcus mitis]MQP86411.1 restriction endonuclease subunit S [Streptococcus mitis]MQP87973.1 restriction endonuclease subunit S [Streptococcus mitis]
MVKIKLGDVIDFKNGKSVKKSDGVIPIYGGNGILGYTDKSNFSHTIVVGRVGAYCGSIYVEENSCWVSDNAISGVPKEGHDLTYLYYVLKSLNLNSKQIGSSQPLITQSMLKDMVVDIEINIENQKRIANSISIIDQKIQTNSQINQELEAMAKTFYDYWFVQFNFPDQNGNPYKSSGGKMVYNPELKREIPEGWGVEKLKYFLTIKNGKDHKHLQDGKFAVYGSGGIMRTVADYLYSGESILFPRKGTLNNVMYVNEEFWTVDTMFYSEVNKNNSALYVFYSVKDIDFNKLNTGTGVPSMTSSILYDLNIIVPEENILEKFNTIVKQNYETIKLNNIQNQELNQLRDWLLPMLMNGQVKVE